MDFFKNKFKKKDVARKVEEAIQKLREMEEMLRKKQDFLEEKIEQEIETAKKNGFKNKRGKLVSCLSFGCA